MRIDEQIAYIVDKTNGDRVLTGIIIRFQNTPNRTKHSFSIGWIRHQKLTIYS